MSRVTDTVVGGGVGALSPFTAGRVTYISATDPPTIGAMSVAAFSLGTGGTHPALVVSLTPGTDPQPGASEPLRVSGGAIIEGVGADSVLIGRGAATPGASAIAIGRLATTAGSNSIAIGASTTATTAGATAVGVSADATGNNTVAIGQNAQATVQSACAVGDGSSATGVNATALGTNAASSGTAAVAVGQGTTANGAGAIIVGNNVTANAKADVVVIAQGGLTAQTNWTVIHGGTPTNLSAAATPLVIVGGGAMTVTHAGNIVLGHGFTSFAANVCAIGGNATNSFIGTVVVGAGNTATASLGGLTVRCTNGITTNNLVMGNLTVIAPLGTGSAASGSILLQTGLTQAAGNTQHPARTGVAVNASGTAADTDLLVFDVNTATLARVSVGAAGSGGVGFKVLRIPN
jgi:hypothetical protein